MLMMLVLVLVVVMVLMLGSPVIEGSDPGVTKTWDES